MSLEKMKKFNEMLVKMINETEKRLMSIRIEIESTVDGRVFSFEEIERLNSMAIREERKFKFLKGINMMLLAAIDANDLNYFTNRIYDLIESGLTNNPENNPVLHDIFRRVRFDLLEN